MGRRIVILGSTGSIGRQAMDVARALPEEITVVGLACGRNLAELDSQVREFRPAYVAAPSLTLGSVFGGSALVVTLNDLAEVPEADLVLVATTGAKGLTPTIRALQAGKIVALANKEVLVMAGALVKQLAGPGNERLWPVDSEHSAIWQCLAGESAMGAAHPLETVRRLILTASGGAFRDVPIATLEQMSSAQALAHPNWTMGQKVTIDSATLVNKAFELIEARWLFDLPFEQVDALIHRESIVHSLVEFIDGSVKAQLGAPDMRIPIQYALTFPHRQPSRWAPLRLEEIGQLTFSAIDDKRYPCFGLAIVAGRQGGTYPAVLSAADDVAVDLFSEGKIGFTDIRRLIEGTLERHQSVRQPSLDDILAADVWARSTARALAVGTQRATISS